MTKIVGHFRRYDRKRLALLFNMNKIYEIQYSKGFNFVSMFGWWLNAVVLKRNKMGKIQLENLRYACANDPNFANYFAPCLVFL